MSLIKLWIQWAAAQRVCDKCGKKKDLSGGKTCESGHFLCFKCHDNYYTKCPLCKKPLR